MKFEYMFQSIKDKCLVLDIETSAFDTAGRAINIHSQFDAYVEHADVKWFGAYSYKNDELYLLNAITERDKIIELLNEHEILIGFNLEEFDVPILKNKDFIGKEKKYNYIDCMQILGKSNFKNKSGYAYKNRGGLMNYSFKNNSLRVMAEEMKLTVQKGDIDYTIFQKNTWTTDETNEIKKYLQSDIVVVIDMFDILWDFWVPFTDLLDAKFVNDLSWIKSSIASLTYKAACTLMGVEPTYADKVNDESIEQMGGRVIMPKYEEARGVWYVDYASLYPHIFCMFNLFAENKTSAETYGWHGNDVFKVKGYYYDTEEHILNAQVRSKLKERITLKKTDPDNPMIYAIKIFLNGLYGVARSSIFEKVHTTNCGWDCCWLGQQIQELTETMMSEMGFETIYGDTDSLMLLAKDEKYNNKEYVQECLAKVLKKINDNVPFPVETFGIDIENHLDYIMFPFSDQAIQDEEGKNIKTGNKLVRERKGKKKNYMYICDNDITLVGLPIKKSNATYLGIKIFEEVLKPIILETKQAKFERTFIQSTIDNYLKKDGIMQLISQEYKVKSANSYKKESQIHAQISKAYCNSEDGIINLIKNKKVGKCGKGMKYCTVQEAMDNNLTSEDLDLTKLWNEIEPFVKYEAPVIVPKIRKIRAEAASKKVSVHDAKIAAQKVELTWIGKDEEPRLEPRILIEDIDKSYGAKDTQNMLIHGDNLLALKALEQDFAGKIKCIYIDPPYNINAAGVPYDDFIEHSLWLSLMKPRIELLRNLLSEDGIFFIQIDDFEQAYLKILCDEIFGRSNFVSTIVVESGEVFGTKAAHLDKTFVKVKDYVMVYFKNHTRRGKLKTLWTKTSEIFDSHYSVYLSDNLEKSSLLEHLKKIDWVNKLFTKYEIKLSLNNISKMMELDEKFKDFIILDISKNIFQDQPFSRKLDEQTLKLFETQNIVNLKGTYLFRTSSGSIRYYQSFSEAIHKTDDYSSEICRSTARGDLWKNYHIDMRNIGNEGNVEFKNSKKPERLIRDILSSYTSEGDWIMDSFLGSGTTAAVAQKMNRRWIGVELGAHCYTHCLPRLQKVCDGTDQSGISKVVEWNGGGGFKFYELAPSLLKKDKKIKKAKVIKKEPELKEEIKNDTTEISEVNCYYEE